MTSIELSTLRPEYTEQRHGIYVRALTDALNRTGPDRPRNIAVTGGYGSGKSSVLHQLAENYGDRALVIELSSLGGDEPAHGVDDKNSKSPIVTKFIQKEIVKQLLFRRSPDAMAGSRYRRVEAFNEQRAWGIATIVTLILFSVAVALGGLDLLDKRIPGISTTVKPLVVGVLLIGLFAILVGVQKLAYGRLRIEKLSAGPATVSLNDQSAYYFDEYLDELLFFFQKTAFDVVIFEDIDRFNNPHIFDTLRELNTILNNSEQVGREIRFIYALRDSIFEQVEITGTVDALTLPTASTTRTKFFDLVVPLVPFISHKSARDLLHGQMASATHPVSEQAIALVSRYLTDMRLMINIRNEYDIFTQKVLVEGKVEGLSADNLFALVVYKNLHLGDFENISVGASDLDKVITAINGSVEAAITGIDAEIADAAAKLDDGEFEDEDAICDRLGSRLDRILTLAIQPFPWKGTLLVGGAKFDRESIRTMPFWRALADSEAATLQLSNNYTHQIATSEIAELLEVELSPSSWSSEAADGVRATIEGLRARKQLLLVRGIAGHLGDKSLTTATSGTSQPLINRVHELVGDGLPFELLVAGMIDQNFALYAAQYYGNTVSASARSFIIRSVQPKTALRNYKFDTAESINQVLAEEGEMFLRTDSAFNTELFDHLLVNAPHQLAVAIERIKATDEVASSFLAHYARNGAVPELLFRELAPDWSPTFSYIAELDGTDELQRDRMLDASLRAAQPKTVYSKSEKLRELIRHRHLELPIFSNEVPADQVAQVAAVLHTLAVDLPSLGDLPPHVWPPIAAQKAYDLTYENLTLVADGHDLSLNAIKREAQAAYDHALEHLDAYVALAVKHRFATIEANGDSLDIINDLMSVSDRSAVHGALRAGDRKLRISVLADPPIKYSPNWSALVGSGRVMPTWANVWNYFVEIPGNDTVDKFLASLLKGVDRVLDVHGPEEEKQRLAMGVINTKDLTAKKKAAIVKSLSLEDHVALHNIEYNRQDPMLLAALVGAGLLPDDGTVYEYIEQESWPEREHLLSVSSRFPNYLAELSIPQADLDRIVRSSQIGVGSKLAILWHITDLTEPLDEATLRSLVKLADDSMAALPLEALTRVTDRLKESALVVALARHSMQTLDADQFRELMAHLGAPYDQLDSRGGALFLDDTPGNAALAARAEELGVVRSLGQDKRKPNQIKVNRHKP